ncbi:putative HTH-type transcriptional regulator YdfH [Marinomonas aquimarina]|uniref:Putative HTH-type transcriptional regulator YdfH n=1 Tax=Marinomonas aquimarina TaxID=295068 RepID=A0A1A8TJX8_9GAMM|nr:GntR family transcriptional regulator [Marinomonas aquimarina]SBS33804.1 putative HTH-type transcriptional regulator YdfH [Marinomonas aquimarina]
MQKTQTNVVTTLRQMILEEELAAGTRLAEIPTAEKLGVSRTPVRIAFRALEQEGLLTKLPGRGYEVRSVSVAEIIGAVEVRGVLEGLAARQAAENGLSDAHKSELQALLDLGDEILAGDELNEAELERYQQMNKRFHDIVIEAAHNPAIQAALSRNEHLPFASSSALAFDKKQMSKETKRFEFAHQQHHHVFYAMINGLGSRAEGIMREHANATLGYINNPRNTDELTVISERDRTRN